MLPLARLLPLLRRAPAAAASAAAPRTLPLRAARVQPRAVRLSQAPRAVEPKVSSWRHVRGGQVDVSRENGAAGIQEGGIGRGARGNGMPREARRLKATGSTCCTSIWLNISTVRSANRQGSNKEVRLPASERPFAELTVAEKGTVAAPAAG